MEFLMRPIGEELEPGEQDIAGKTDRLNTRAFFSEVLDRLESVLIDSQIGDFGLQRLAWDPE